MTEQFSVLKNGLSCVVTVGEVTLQRKTNEETMRDNPGKTQGRLERIGICPHVVAYCRNSFEIFNSMNNK